MKISPLQVGSCILLVALLPSLSACSRREQGTEPPVVHLDEDVCEQCGMIVSDDRFASAIVSLENGQRLVHIYDDIGEMAQNTDKMAHPDTSIYVHDYNSREWIDARTAWFVQSEKLMTPMASGIAAFATRDQALKFSTKYPGEILDFNMLTK